MDVLKKYRKERLVVEINGQGVSKMAFL
jgi:hypothetical protein